MKNKQITSDYYGRKYVTPITNTSLFNVSKIILSIGLILGLIILGTSCGSPSRDRYEDPNIHAKQHNCKQAISVTSNSQSKSIIIETLHHGKLPYGVYKITVDSNEYIYTQSTRGGATLQFHGNVK